MNHDRSLDELTARLRDADPIDGCELAGRIDPSIDEAIAEIIGGTVDSSDDLESVVPPPPSGGGVRLRRSPGRWSLAAAACVATLAMAAGLVALWPGSAEPAYAITIDDGVIVVNWVRDLRDGNAITDDLRSLGVDAEVLTTPASPSQVGRILVATVDGIERGDVPPGISWGADGSDEVFTWKIDPSQFSGQITVEIGVETDPGDPYLSAESAFAPGEVLGGLDCALEETGKPVTAAAIDRQLRRLDLDAAWIRVTEAAESTTGDRADNTPVPSPPVGPVLDAVPLDDHTIEVSVAPPGAPSSLPIFSPQRPSGECTPALAGPWMAHI